MGALLLSVEPSSAAYRAGLRQFDIVTEFAGRAITCMDDLVEEISRCYAGEVVSVTVFTFSRRFDDGEVRTVSFALDPAS